MTSNVLSPALAGKLVRADQDSGAWGQTDMAAAILGLYDPRNSNAAPFRLLEAGGGSSSWLPLPSGSEITTVDISQEQLDRNTYASEKLLGDLQTFDYGARRFDLIVCWDVLEHLEQPEAALDRLLATLRPDGRLIIKGPLPRSLKGFITRWTPHAAHVAFYRYVLGVRTAGQPGYAPFKAHVKAAADPGTIAWILARHGCVVDAARGFESDQVAALKAKSPLLLGLYRLAETALSAASLGYYSRGMTDFFLIARRPD